MIGHLRTAGEALCGPHWQSEVGRALGVSDRAVRRWLAGEASPPDDLSVRLKRLIDQRIKTLKLVRNRLPA